MRKTSIDAYNTIKRNGLLGKLKWKVYDYVFHHGPAYPELVWRKIHGKGTTGSITPRFSELEREGVFEVVGNAVSPESNMTVTLWDVTDQLPRKLNGTKLPTRNEIIGGMAKQLNEVLKANEISGKEKNDNWDLWTDQTRRLLNESIRFRKGRR